MQRFCSYVMFPVYLQRIFTRSVSKNNAAGRKILDEHSDVIFIKIDQHLEKLYKENKGFQIFWNTVYTHRSLFTTDVVY